jgi:hypothetical protein
MQVVVVGQLITELREWAAMVVVVQVARLELA